LDTHAGPQAVLKTYTRHGYEAPSQVNQRFRSRGVLRVASNIGRSDQYQTLAFGWLTGRVLSDALLDPALSAGQMELVGAALAELHNQEAEGLPLQTGADVAKALLAEADTLGVLSPTIAPRAQALAQKLATRMASSAPCNRPVHGDFHARQVLLDGETAAILDLDQVCQGDPYGDLGFFLAHLEREVIRGRLAPEHVPTLRKRFLTGYAVTTGKPIAAPHLNAYTSTLLLRLAPRFFRYREPDWPDRIERTVARAEAIFEEA
jgi:Ser/Thr protein kinase RdoA (MazF antagonist)